MANPIVQVFRCIWNVIVGSSRIILFMGCLVLIVFEIFRLGDPSGIVQQNFRLEGHISPTASYNPFYNPASIMIFALFGALAAFFNHSSIKVFPLILILCIVSTSYELSQEFKEEKLKELDRQFGQKFNSSMLEYDWDHENMSERQTKATEYVDTIQSLIKCCGYNDSSEWDDLRPQGWSRETYPVSCCFQNEAFQDSSKSRSCYKGSQMVLGGCHQSFVLSQTIVAICGLVHIFYLMVLAPIALISQCTCSADKASQQDRAYTGIAYN